MIKKIIHHFIPTIRVGDLIYVSKNGFWKYRSFPNRSLNKTARIFNKTGGETIVEIGTGIHGRESGNSMIIWTRKTNAKLIIALDLDQTRINEVKKVTTKYNNVKLILADGIEYLSKSDLIIDLLYLDFWTPDLDGSISGTGRAHAYKDAYFAAKDQMNAQSMILIDDTDHIHPWKHTYIVPEARKDGFEVLYTGRQTLLVR